MAYSGNSIVDFLSQSGQASDFSSRAALAASKGIQNYTGTAAQNTQLLQTLRSSTPATPAQPTIPVVPTPTTSQPQSQPTQPQPQQAPQANQPTATGLEQDLINAMTSKGHTPETAKAAIQGRGYADLAREYLGSTTTSGGATLGTSMSQPTIDLPKLYQTMYDSSGISLKQDELNTKEKQYLEAKAKISDNPFLDASTVDKRLQRLSNLYESETVGLRNEIATRKADIETKLNLQLKQFDINSEQARQSLSQFNTLLSAGALDGASGEDIANITRSTGLSSDMISSAIQANKKKNTNTSTISFDDGVSQGFAIINADTGEIINKQVVASSKPKAASTADQKVLEEQETQKNAIGDIQRGAVLRDVVNHYGIPGGLSVEEIFRLYNSYSPYGQAQEDIESVKEGRFVS